MSLSRLSMFSLLVVTALSLTACKTQVVNTTGQYVSPQAATALPRPQVVYVSNFTADRASLGLDQGIGPRLQRQLEGDSVATDRQQMLFEAQDAIADTLVSQIRGMGIPAERAAGEPPTGANALLVRGQLERVDEGNRTRRLVVGFGAGKSDVGAQVQVVYYRPGALPQLIQTYDADSNSGRKPGMAVGAASAAQGSFGMLAASGATGAVAEHRTDVGKEGEALARRVAYDLGQYFVKQGWIPPSAAPDYPLR
jgi:hypothetical protein